MIKKSPCLRRVLTTARSSGTPNGSHKGARFCSNSATCSCLNLKAISASSVSNSAQLFVPREMAIIAFRYFSSQCSYNLKAPNTSDCSLFPTWLKLSLNILQKAFLLSLSNLQNLAKLLFELSVAIFFSPFLLPFAIPERRIQTSSRSGDTFNFSAISSVEYILPAAIESKPGIYCGGMRWVPWS